MIPASLLVIIIQKLWQGIAGFLTVIIVARYLNGTEQGWYYTFLSVAALYSIFEMGLSAVLVQISAHLFIDLRWVAKGGVEGEGAAEFVSFVSQALISFFCMALIFFAAALIFGIVYFSSREIGDESYQWIYPWVFLVAFTSLNMVTLAFFSIIEGTGLVREVYWIRFIQGLLSAMGCWACLILGAGLWASVMTPAISAIYATMWLILKRPQFINLFFYVETARKFLWRDRVWPMQWRVGLSWVGNYLMSQLATPIVFYYQGPIPAGKIGLSITIAHMVGIFSQSWFAQSVTEMTHSASQRDWSRLSKTFYKNLLGYSLTFLAGSLIVLFLLKILQGTIYESRVLSYVDFCCLLGFVFLYQLNAGFALQLRVFGREPLVWISILGGSLIFFGTFFVVIDYSLSGVVAAMLGVQLFIISPISFGIWAVSNQRWRKDCIGWNHA